MKYKLFINNHFAGESDLEYPDEGMNVYQGQFVGSPGYGRWKRVFRLFAESVDKTSTDTRDEKLLAQFFREKAKLHLKVVREDGAICEGGHRIHIDDFSEEAGKDAMILTLWQPVWTGGRRFGIGNVVAEWQKFLLTDANRRAIARLMLLAACLAASIALAVAP
jgi:hypothetical protein